MKKEMILIIFILLFVSINFSAVTFTYPSFDGERTNSSYSVSWLWDNTSWKCFSLFEDGGLLAFYNSNNVSDEFPVTAGISKSVVYQVKPFETLDCSGPVPDSEKSLEFTLIIDSVSPTVVSNSPINDFSNANPTGVVIVNFSEEMDTSIITLSGGIFSGQPSETWSNEGKTVTRSYSGTKGASVSYDINGEDLAGNTVTGEIVFDIGVSPTTLTITSPNDGEDYLQNSPVSVSVTVTDGSKPCLGAVVTTSGACSATLTEDGDGVYSGSCVLDTFGDSIRLIATATKWDDETDGSVLINVDKKLGLSIDVSYPKTFNLVRGESSDLIVLVTSEGASGTIKVSDAIVTAPGITFERSTENRYKGKVTTSYLTPLNYNFDVSASATVDSQDMSTSIPVSFKMIPVELNVESSFLQNDVETEIIYSGKSISLKVKALYPDETVASGEVTGTFEVSNTVNPPPAKNLTFTKSGDYYITETIHTAGDYDSAYTASITFIDSVGNEGVSSTSITGPAKGLKFETEGVLIFAPGQNVKIIGKVYSELDQKYLTTAEIEFDEKKYTHTKLGYVIPYSIPLDFSSGEKSLNLLIKGNSLEYPFPLNIMISKELSVTLPNATEKGQPVKVQILYPNGEQVTTGNFSIIAGGEIFELTKTDDGWVTNLNLGIVDSNFDISLSGTDSFGNALSQEETIGYTISQLEKAKANPMQAIMVVLGVLVVLFVISYVYAYTKIRAGSTVSKGDLIRRYRHLLLEREKINYMKKKIRVDVMTRKISQDESRIFERESLQRSNDILTQLSEMESKYDYIRTSKNSYQQSALREIEKIKEYLKQNIREETEITKAMTAMKKQIEYGEDPKVVKQKVLNKFGNAGKKAVQRAEIEGLIGTKYSKRIKKVSHSPVQEIKLLLRSGTPEQAVKRSLINEGLTEREALDLIDKAKRL